MTDLIPVESIISKIIFLRGEKALLDRDLAELYGVETKQLKRAVRRNIKRFPDDFVLTPGRYVGAPPQKDDGEPFEEKMARLTVALKEQFAEGVRLESEIRKNLAGLGYEL